MNKELVQKLVNCEISWSEFSSIEKCSSYLIELDDTIINIDTIIVGKAIQCCLDNEYTMQDLLDWANVVRFSDIFLVNEDCRDCVISILDRIEESDEEGSELSNNDLLLMIDRLNKNEEW
ncbi:MAG: hypothetical protein IKA85_08435 [Clostridia bacterium]|nr:hypothetical protein [Clostridia bacterium]MBR2377776.1 hypothetical protein [Clostridia bacterium]